MKNQKLETIYANYLKRLRDIFDELSYLSSESHTKNIEEMKKEIFRIQENLFDVFLTIKNNTNRMSEE